MVWFCWAEQDCLWLCRSWMCPLRFLRGWEARGKGHQEQENRRNWRGSIRTGHWKCHPSGLCLPLRMSWMNAQPRKIPVVYWDQLGGLWNWDLLMFGWEETVGCWISLQITWVHCLPYRIHKDPRFESLCGDYSLSRFRQHYSFLYDEVLPDEALGIKKQLKVDFQIRKFILPHPTPYRAFLNMCGYGHKLYCKCLVFVATGEHYASHTKCRYSSRWVDGQLSLAVEWLIKLKARNLSLYLVPEAVLNHIHAQACVHSVQ